MIPLECKNPVICKKSEDLVGARRVGILIKLYRLVLLNDCAYS